MKDICVAMDTFDWVRINAFTKAARSILRITAERSIPEYLLIAYILPSVDPQDFYGIFVGTCPGPENKLGNGWKWTTDPDFRKM